MSDSEQRKTIFYEELKKLKDNDYITEQDYLAIFSSYQKYSEYLWQEKQQELIRLEEKRRMEEMQALRIREEQLEQERLRKERAKPTPEQIRERNITWGLIAGVILLFIAGLAYATSSWDSMNHFMKVFALIFVLFLFYLISFVSHKWLKIEKTSFAFLVLASLLIPVTFIGIGFFELFGEWLSLFGPGRYVLGIITTVFCLPIYSAIGHYRKNRLFIWLSLLTLTSFVAFSLAALYLPVDWFYLGIMIYNASILAIYYLLKKESRVRVFIQEVPLFSQLNLIISTLFLLLFFQSEVFYSFNLLLTASLYIAMVFVYNNKHYHFVFTLLLVYGLYQLFEHSFIQNLSPVGFAFIGIGYLLLENKLNDRYLKNVFKYTSGILSLFAFIYVSLEGIQLRNDGSPLVLFIAYTIIAINYCCLAYLTKKRVFVYLAPIFLAVAGSQLWINVISEKLNLNIDGIFMFFVGLSLFVLLFLFNNNKYLLTIKQSSFVVSIVTMILAMLLSIGTSKWTESSLLFLLFGIIAIVIWQHHEHKYIRNSFTWVVPISWMLSLLFLYNSIPDNDYVNMMGVVGHGAISAIMIMFVGYGFKKTSLKPLFMPMFIVSLSSYAYCLITSFQIHFDYPVIRALMFFVGVILGVFLVYETKIHQFWITVSVTTVFFFLTLIDTFHLSDSPERLVFSLFLIPVILILIVEYLGRMIKQLQLAFFWTAHGALAIFLFVGLGYYAFKQFVPTVFLLPLIIYLYSILKRKTEWEIKLFLYLGFTVFTLNLLLLFSHFDLGVLTVEKAIGVAALIIGVLWWTLNPISKKRVEYFLVPLSIVSIVPFSLQYSLSFIDLVFATGFLTLSVYITLYRKWDFILFVPLMLYTIIWINATSQFNLVWMVVAFIFAIGVLQLVGLVRYKHLLHSNQSNKMPTLDYFTAFAGVYVLLFQMMITNNEPLFVKLLPSLTVVILLFLQRTRVTSEIATRVVTTLTAGSVLIPYYIFIDNIRIPELLHTEMVVLPFLVLTVYLQLNTWKDKIGMMNVIQRVVLILVAFVLMLDALQSNTVYDAIIIGTLSLVSMIAGMHFRIKSYFLVGFIVLFLTIFLQTRPLWGNLPWWGYMFIGGITLLSFASFYEWQKQRTKKEGKSTFQKKKEQLIQAFKDWNW